MSRYSTDIHDLETSIKMIKTQYIPNAPDKATKDAWRSQLPKLESDLKYLKSKEKEEEDEKKAREKKAKQDEKDNKRWWKEHAKQNKQSSSSSSSSGGYASGGESSTNYSDLIKMFDGAVGDKQKKLFGRGCLVLVVIWIILYIVVRIVRWFIY